jgi:hypothetical protein
MLSCVDRVLSTGQCPFQGAQPNVYKKFPNLGKRRPLASLVCVAIQEVDSRNIDPLNSEIHLRLCSRSHFASHRNTLLLYYKDHRLMLFREIIAAYSENPMKHIHCIKKMLVVYIVTSVRQVISKAGSL